MSNYRTKENIGEWTVENSEGRDVRFTGERLGSAASTANNASSYYSGQTGRWVELALYRTQAGRYVCEKVERTQSQGDQASALVCDTVEEVMAFFGHDWVAKGLYDEAGIDTTQVIE